jgi:hypothetical protein
MHIKLRYVHILSSCNGENYLDRSKFYHRTVCFVVVDSFLLRKTTSISLALKRWIEPSRLYFNLKTNLQLTVFLLGGTSSSTHVRASLSDSISSRIAASQLALCGDAIASSYVVGSSCMTLVVAMQA